MKRIVAVLWLSAAICVAQVPSHKSAGQQTANPHGAMGTDAQRANPHAAMPGGMPNGITGHGAGSHRASMAKECGIGDPAFEKATTLLQRANGSWAPLKSESDTKKDDKGFARVWREKSSFIDMQEASASGDTMHITRMCFAPDGTLVKLEDQFVAPNQCACSRVTETTYSAGKVVKREQNYYKMPSHEKMDAPKDAAKFPAVPEYRKLEQAPFYGFVKK